MRILKIYLKLIFLLLLIFGTPIIVHSLLTFGDAVTDNDWIGFFGNYFGAILGVIAAVLISREQIKSSKDDLLKQFEVQNNQVQERINNEIKIQKLSTRVFLQYTMLIDNVILHGKNEENNEILLHPQIHMFIKHNPNEYLKTTKATFLKIEYFGLAESILDVHIRFKLRQYQDSDYEAELYRIGINKKRHIYIPLFLNGDKKELLSFSVEYTTLSQERIRFVSDLINEKEKYFLIEHFQEKLIFETNVKNEIYINPGNNNSTN